MLARPSAVTARGALALLLALLLGLEVGYVVGVGRPVPPPPEVEQLGALAPLPEAWQLLREEFLEAASLDERSLVHGAVRGMAQSVADPNTRFEPPREHAASMEGFSGRFEGIGAYLDLRDGRLVVAAPIEGSPADAAGLRAGDAILAVDGAPTEGWSVDTAVARIRGPAGTPVTLTVRRGEAAPRQVTIVRAQVRIISARGRLLEPGIGVLRIASFHRGTDEEVGTVLDELRGQGARALVLDVRGNGGGLLDVAARVAGRFIAAGPILTETYARRQPYVYDRAADQPLVDWPLAVLVDHGTVSAAEAFAAALRGADRAPLVGQTTFGKGTVQHVYRLSDGSGLQVTVARWAGPADTRPRGGGLPPDVPVGEEPAGGRDPALERGTALLRERLASEPAAPSPQPTQGRGIGPLPALPVDTAP
jgi:carboxyl-terminal processing protease